MHPAQKAVLDAARRVHASFFGDFEQAILDLLDAVSRLEEKDTKQHGHDAPDSQ